MSASGPGADPPQPPDRGSAKGDPGGGGSSSLAKRILVLAQKGDWASCESSLKALERSAGEEGASKPLAGISDNVSIFFRAVVVMAKKYHYYGINCI